MTLQERIDELAKNTWVKSIIDKPTVQANITNGDTIYLVSYVEVNDDLDIVTTRNQSFYVDGAGNAFYHVSKPAQSFPKAQ